MVHMPLVFLLISAVRVSNTAANPTYYDDYTTTTRGPHIVPKLEEKFSAPVYRVLQNQTTSSRLVKYIDDLCQGTIKEGYATNLRLPISRGVEFFVNAEQFPTFSPQLILRQNANRFIPLGRHHLFIHSTDQSAFDIERTLCNWHQTVHTQARLWSHYPEFICRIVRFEDFGLTTVTGEPLTQVFYVVYISAEEENVFDDSAYNRFAAVYHPHPARYPSARALSEAATGLELPVYRGPINKQSASLYQITGEYSQTEMENTVAEMFSPENIREPGGCPNLKNTSMRFSVKTEPVFASGVAPDGHIWLQNYTAFAYGIWINGTLFWPCATNRHACDPSMYGGRGHSNQPTNREAADGPRIRWSNKVLIPTSFSRPVYPSVPTNVQYTKHIQEYLSTKLSDALGINDDSVVVAFNVVLWYHFSENGTQPHVAIMFNSSNQDGPESQFFLDPRLRYAGDIFNKLTEIPVDMTTWTLYHEADPAAIRFTFEKQEYQRRDFYSLQEFSLLLSRIPVKKVQYYRRDENDQASDRTLNSSSVLAAVAQAFNESNPISIQNVALEVVLTQRVDGFLDVHGQNASRFDFQLRYPEPTKFQFIWRYPSREQLAANLLVHANATLSKPPILEQTD